MCQHDNFVIHKHIGVLKSSRNSEWSKEINIVSWHGGEEKYEIRSWKDNHRQHQNNGMRINEDEVIELVKILKKDTAKRKVLRAATKGKILVPYDKPSGKNYYKNAYFVEHIGTFSESFASRKEVNLMIWDSLYHKDATGEVKYDLRWWDNSDSPYHSRGVRLTRNEALEFIDIMAKELELDLDYLSEKGETFNVRDKVRHSKFGQGVVTKVNNDEITVIFPIKGERTFSKEFIDNNKILVKIEDEKEEEIKEPVFDDEYPVEFEEGVDFLGYGTVIPNVGELLSVCSEKLYSLSQEMVEMKAFLIYCQQRYLAGDMGEGNEEEIREKTARFHEGQPVLGYYKTILVDEGAVLMGFSDELCYEYPENPRDFIALLPSEEKLISEWHERNPDA